MNRKENRFLDYLLEEINSTKRYIGEAESTSVRKMFNIKLIRLEKTKSEFKNIFYNISNVGYLIPNQLNVSQTQINKRINIYKSMRKKHGMYKGFYKWDLAKAFYSMSNDVMYELFGFNFIPNQFNDLDKDIRNELGYITACSITDNIKHEIYNSLQNIKPTTISYNDESIVQQINVNSVLVNKESISKCSNNLKNGGLKL